MLAAAVLVAACWIPSPFVDYWVDNQDDAAYSVRVQFPDGDGYTLLVPPNTQGILIQGTAGVPHLVLVRDESGALVASFETSHEDVGVIIEQGGHVRVEDGGQAPFSGAEQLELSPPLDE